MRSKLAHGLQTGQWKFLHSLKVQRLVKEIAQLKEDRAKAVLIV